MTYYMIYVQYIYIYDILLLSNDGRPENCGIVDERTKHYVAEDDSRAQSQPNRKYYVGRYYGGGNGVNSERVNDTFPVHGGLFMFPFRHHISFPTHYTRIEGHVFFIEYR